MSEVSPYEVRCPSCQTSFAPNTKRCIHCGGPLGRRLFAPMASSGAPEMPDDAVVIHTSDGELEVEDEMPTRGLGRNFLYLLMFGLAIAGQFLREC